MIRSVRFLLATVVLGVSVGVMTTGEPAEARCRMWEATHNGTNMFYASGSAGTAAEKLRWQVEHWKQDTLRKNVKIGKIKTSCGKWFTKYMLPHTHCVAKARVCF